MPLLTRNSKLVTHTTSAKVLKPLKTGDECSSQHPVWWWSQQPTSMRLFGGYPLLKASLHNAQTYCIHKGSLGLTTCVSLHKDAAPSNLSPANIGKPTLGQTFAIDSIRNGHSFLDLHWALYIGRHAWRLAPTHSHQVWRFFFTTAQSSHHKKQTCASSFQCHCLPLSYTPGGSSST